MASCRYSHYHRRSSGDYARRHLEEAAAFSREIGGTDKDVKEYFFSLPYNELDAILREYGKKFGLDAEKYARNTFSAWKTGQRGMSGLVAKRLFDLLPFYMPLSKKYDLAENVWRHFGPASTHYYVVGPVADINTLVHIIAGKLDATVTEFTIPENVKNRFRWLSAGDIRVEEQLFNYFRQLQKKLAIQKLQLEIPILQQQVLLNSNKTGLTRSQIQIHKHAIYITVNSEYNNIIQETSSLDLPLSSNKSVDDYGCVWIIIVFVILFLLLKS